MLAMGGNMAKKKKKETVSMPELFGGWMTYLYLIVMFGFFPVYYPGNLFGISSLKRNIFTAVAAVYLLLAVIPFISVKMSDRKKKQKCKPDLTDVFALVFLAAVVVSSFVALDRTEAVSGQVAGKTGAIVMILCLGSYLLLKRFAWYDKILIWVNLAASAFIYLSGIFITCQADILNMQQGIDVSQKAIFVSPLGNIDYNVAYVSVMLSAAMVMFLLCKDVFTKRLLAGYLMLGFMDVFCLRVESVMVTMIGVFAVLLYFALENKERLMRYLMLVQLFFGANVVVFLLKGRMYPFSGIGAFLLKPQIVVAEVALIVLLFLPQWKHGWIKNEIFPRIQKIYLILLAAAVAAAVVFFVAVNLYYSGTAPSNALAGLVLTDHTGNGRGYIWSRTVKLFAELPPGNKLFGCGLGCFYDFVGSYRDDMMNRFNSVFYDPHNDFLHVLIATGIVGVIGFFGMIFTSMVSALKKRKTNEMQIALVLLLVAFLIQGLVNSFTIFIIPQLFLILGMAGARRE